MSTEMPFDKTTSFQKGQRLLCMKCGSEIEVVIPCGCNPPRQVFRCCGADMVPSEGTPQRLKSE